ncbi:MAG TPA: J domain-containing protein [Ktedonobacteraceae bacterium]|jgi:curved DNA-binding protein|nr:J domain-containing protein [Ktedonobacteraceae bacterium]
MATEYKDYYSTLGVNKNADDKAIRQAFRKLARKYHPDVNPGDKSAEAKFKEINEANEVLSDPEKRKKYDEMSNYYQQYGRWPGAAGPAAGAAAGATGFGGGNYQYRTVNEEDLEDLFGGGQSPFSSFFNTYFHSDFAPGSERRSYYTNTRRPQRPLSRGEDIESAVEVTLAEAYTGTKRTFELSDPDGKTHRLEVTIPAGVDEGARIRIAGQGSQGDAGRGDLYLRVHMLADPRFTREGTTLRTAIEVPLAICLLGGDAFVVTPDGRRLLLRIPPETQNGKMFRLRGQGMPEQVGKTEKRGDLYAEVKAVLPTHLSEEQRRLFEAFARTTGYTGPATQAETGGKHV